MRAFTRPGLIIHDRDDLLIPYTVGQAVAENWEGTQFISTEKLGHRRGLGHTAVLNHLFAFLGTESRVPYAANCKPYAVHGLRKTANGAACVIAF